MENALRPLIAATINRGSKIREARISRNIRPHMIYAKPHRPNKEGARREG
jgi:hypothetical protein